MNRTWLADALLALGTFGAGMGCGGSIEGTAPGASPAPTSAPRVKVVSPIRETARVVTFQPARIEAFEETPIHPRVAGYIDHIPVDIGDAVKAGDPLVVISAPELQEELKQKEALRDQAKAEVKQADAGVGAAEAALEAVEAKVRESKAGVARSNADLARWKAEHARISELASGGSVTRKLAEETLNSFRSAEAALQEAIARQESSGAAIRAAQATVLKAKSDVDAAAARLKVAEANVAYTRTLTGYLVIKAPYDGRVTQRNVDTGHFVQPASANSAKPMLVVDRIDRVRVFIDVPETEAEHADKEDAVLVTVPALRGRTLHGKVARTSWALDAANRSIRVEVDLDNDGTLRPGMFATVEVVLAESSNALVLPASCIVRDNATTFVAAVRDGIVVRKPVKLGLRSGGKIEVVEGVTESDVLISAEPASFKEGSAVEVEPAAAKP